MNVLVLGTKDVIPREVVYRAIEESGFEVECIGSPGTAGVGQAAISYARDYFGGLYWRNNTDIFSPLQRNAGVLGEWADAIVVVGEPAEEHLSALDVAGDRGIPIKYTTVTTARVVA